MKKRNIAYLVAMFCIMLFLTYTMATKTYEAGIFDIMTVILIMAITVSAMRRYISVAGVIIPIASSRPIIKLNQKSVSVNSEVLLLAARLDI